MPLLRARGGHGGKECRSPRWRDCCLCVRRAGTPRCAVPSSVDLANSRHGPSPTSRRAVGRTVGGQGVPFRWLCVSGRVTSVAAAAPWARIEAGSALPRWSTGSRAWARWRPLDWPRDDDCDDLGQVASSRVQRHPQPCQITRAYPGLCAAVTARAAMPACRISVPSAVGGSPDLASPRRAERRLTLVAGRALALQAVAKLTPLCCLRSRACRNTLRC